MDKLDKLTNAVSVVFIIICMYVFYYYYNKPTVEDIDEDGDGIITKKELTNYIKRELEKKAKEPPKFRSILKSALSGLVRGGLMGLLLTNDLEGAATSALVLGMINPIITGIDHIY